MFNFSSSWPLVSVAAVPGAVIKIRSRSLTRLNSRPGVHWQLQLLNHHLSSTLDVDDTSQLPLDLFVYLPLHLFGVSRGFNGPSNAASRTSQWRRIFAEYSPIEKLKLRYRVSTVGGMRRVGVGLKVWKNAFKDVHRRNSLVLGENNYYDRRN